MCKLAKTRMVVRIRDRVQCVSRYAHTKEGVESRVGDPGKIKLKSLIMVIYIVQKSTSATILQHQGGRNIAGIPTH